MLFRLDFFVGHVASETVTMELSRNVILVTERDPR